MYIACRFHTLDPFSKSSKLRCYCFIAPQVCVASTVPPTCEPQVTDAVRRLAVRCLTGAIVFAQACTVRQRRLTVFADPVLRTETHQVHRAINTHVLTEAIVLAVARTPEIV